MTILSVNKTRELMGAMRLFFVLWARTASIFLFRRNSMRGKIRHLVHAAIFAALYVALTNWQNFIFPGSATWAIQLRLSEALCVLAFFTPAAAPGLAVGCLLFNLNYAAALPLDVVLGTLATWLACKGMWLTRNRLVLGLPVAGLLMPALTNAILVGLELTLYIGGAFWLNALYVAIGEAAVLLIPGSILYRAMKKRSLDKNLFG